MPLIIFAIIGAFIWLIALGIGLVLRRARSRIDEDKAMFLASTHRDYLYARGFKPRRRVTAPY